MPEDPKSLYHYCLEYVASNVSLIESLVGFPEIVGREIFVKAARQDKHTTYYSPTNTRTLAQLFFEAYGRGGHMLASLSLKKAHIFFNDIVDDCWWIFEHLVALDLSSCGLGDDHDVLTSLVGLHRLETLILSDNRLTSQGVRKLTLRSRMFEESCSLLKYLDLSENEGITQRSLSFLKCLPNLSLLNVSVTSITLQEAVLLDNWQPCSEQNICDCITNRFLVTTEGWSTEWLERWKCEYEMSGLKTTQCKGPPSITRSLLGQRFYSKPKSRSEIKPPTTVFEPETKMMCSNLILRSNQFSCPHCQPERHLFDHPAEMVKSSDCERLLAQAVKYQRISKDSFHIKTVLQQRTDCEEDSVLSQYLYSSSAKKLKGHHH